MPREKHKRHTTERREYRCRKLGGSTRSSDEGPVMGLERRGRIRWPDFTPPAAGLFRRYRGLFLLRR